MAGGVRQWRVREDDSLRVEVRPTTSSIQGWMWKHRMLRTAFLRCLPRRWTPGTTGRASTAGTDGPAGIERGALGGTMMVGTMTDRVETFKVMMAVLCHGRGSL